MSDCDHDKRFSGVFFLPKETKGCLACMTEQQAHEIERLERRYGCVKNDMKQAGKLIDKLEAEKERLRQKNKNLADNCYELRQEHERLNKCLDQQLDVNAKLADQSKRLRAALKDVDRWLAAFIAAWDKSRDKKKPSEAPVALMQAIRQHSEIKTALNQSEQE